MKLVIAHIRVICFALLAGILSGCGGGGDGGGGTSTAGVGSLRVALTDAPACGFDQVNITVSKVRVHQSGSASDSDAGWSEVAIVPPRKINLLDLMNGVLEELGQTPLPAGTYTQVRLLLEANAGGLLANSVVPTGGAERALDTPSAVQSGIKINHSFSVDAGQLADIVLDFDACRSIVRRGNGTFGLKPVISAVARTQTAIAGTVDVALNDVVVSAQSGGRVVRSTVPNSVGEFVLSPLDPANAPYTVVITAQDRVSAVISAVPVQAEMTTRISNPSAPISPPMSGPPATHDASGTVTPAAALAELRGLQTVSGVDVEIAHVNANETTGAYSLTLPTGDPEFATYAEPLPLVFAPIPTSAGQYTIEAAASGYVTQSTPVDLSSADQTVDFALILAP